MNRFGSAVRRGIASWVLVLMGSGAMAADEWWTSDFDAAKELAAKGKKDLLVLFTGSDWCSWCRKLDQEVLSQTKFKEAAAADFVLVVLDYPRRTDQTEEVKARNQVISRKYGIKGFPTVALMDADGEVWAMTGYHDGGPEKYLEHLADLKSKRGTDRELWKQAEAASGGERARLLDRWVARRNELRLPVDAKTIYAEIIKLDMDGSAGLKPRYENLLFLDELNARLTELGKARKNTEAAALIAQAIKEREGLPADARQGLYHRQALALLSANDLDGAMTAIEAGEKVDPENNQAMFKQLRQIIDAMKRRPQ